MRKKAVEFSPELHTFRFPLGLKARDVITGFEGILSYRVQYFTGCDQYGIDPGMKDGELMETKQFDENRLQIVGEGVKLPAREPVQLEVEETGGPQTRVAVNRSIQRR